MKKMTVNVSLTKIGKTEIPEALQTVQVFVPLPDDYMTGNSSSFEKLYNSFKDWKRNGFLSEKPVMWSVIQEGLKIVARQEGVKRIKERAMKENIIEPSNGKRGRGSSTSIE